MLLVACPSCTRHVRSTEAHCPFCGYAERVPRRALLAVAAASLCAANCKPEPHEPAPAPSTSGPAPVASHSAVPVSPSPVESAPIDITRLGQAAVYGAPPPPASATNTPRGTVSIESITPQAGAPANTERVVRGMIPGFRACYNRALQTDPEQAAKLQAKLRLTLQIGPGGEVTNATVAPEKPELAAALSCIRARALASLFETTGTASVVTAELTLKLAP